MATNYSLLANISFYSIYYIRHIAMLILLKLLLNIMLLFLLAHTTIISFFLKIKKKIHNSIILISTMI